VDWVIVNIGSVNEWFQYNNLKVVLVFFCYVICYFGVCSHYYIYYPELNLVKTLDDTWRAAREFVSTGQN
jgi:hypothetical protein